VGRRWNVGIDLNNLAIFLDAWAKAEGILATCIKKEMISGKRTTNPEITASKTKRGKNLGNWLGVTARRED
jgi:hypothetical protein